MAVTLVGTHAAVAYADTVSVTVPAAATAGDLIVIYGATTRWPLFATPGTFTLIHEGLSGTATSWEAKMALWVGVVGTDANASDTVAIGNPTINNNYGAALAVFRSSVQTTPDYEPATSAGFAVLADPGSTTPTAPSITLSQDGVLLFAAQVSQSTAGNSHTPPAGYTEHEDVNRAGIGLTIASKTASAGTSGTAASTASIAGAWVASHLHVYDSAVADTENPTVTMAAIHGAGQFDSVFTSAGFSSATDLLTVSGTATDNIGVTLVEVRVNGGAWQAATGTTSWSIALDVDLFPVGSFLIEARSTDAASNVSAIASQPVWFSPDGTWGATSVGNHAMPVELTGY